MPLRRQVVLPEADRKKVNLAQVVQDQMVLYVPDKMNKCRKGCCFKGEEKVQINAASKEQLEKLQVSVLGKQKVF